MADGSHRLRQPLPFNLMRDAHMQRTVFMAALLAVMLATPAAATTPDHDKSPAHQKVNVAGFSFLVEKAPAWIVPVAEDHNIGLSKAPMHYALIDRQLRLEPSGSNSYLHIVRVVDDAAGLATAAQIEAVFDPNYQTLVLHKFEIIRDGKRIDKLDRKKVQLLQRETQLEARMYDGSVTASIVLDDVRVGDRIEYSYSIRGDNPVFDGQLVGDEWMGSDKGPTAQAQFRLLAPAERSIATKSAADIAVSSSVQNGWRDTRFRRTGVAQIQYDASAPASVAFDQMVQFSEFADWVAVRRWGDKLFVPVASAATATAVRQLADEIRTSASTPEQRLLAALTFVQTQIRYFGTEIGTSSHRPAAPATVLEQRFGDCKDKVALLVALLRALDIEAQPVLVSATYEGDVAAMLPSPVAFNHVIARVQLDGKVYWLDATRDQQTGALAQRQTYGMGKGLVLDAASSALADLPGSADQERIAVDERFHMAKMADDPVLESRITYSGEMAEMLRGALASVPVEKIESQLVAEYVHLYPTLRTSAPIRIEEQAGKNAVAVVQQFTVPGFWRFPEQKVLFSEIGLWNLAQATQVPNDPARKLPFRLPYPGIYRQTVALDFPEDVYPASDSKHFNLDDPHFDYQLTYDMAPRRVALSAELDILGDRVAVADWAAYNDKLLKLRPRLFSSIGAPAMSVGDQAKLAAQLRTLAEAMRKGEREARVVSPEQVNARVRLAVLTAQLDGGFLNPRLRAEALVQRGEQRDHLGQTAPAQADFEEALRLLPDNADAAASAAINALLRGDDARARELSQRALKLAPSDTGPHNTLGLIEYFGGDYQAATQDLSAQLAERSNREFIYPTIWLYLASRHSGADGSAAVQQFLPSSPKPRWPYPVLQWLTGSGDYEQAFKVASENSKNPSRLCELYFYAGEKYLLDGDQAKAREYFHKSVDTGVTEFMEYSMAQRELARLGH